MIRQELIEKIADFNFWHKEQEAGIKRKELSEVLKFIDDTEYALIIAGIRREEKHTCVAKSLRKR